MLRGLLLWTRRHGLAVLVGATVAAAVVPAAAAHAAASIRPGMKHVSYQGHRFNVPRAWPVIDLWHHPHTCVRFDKHVIYLGRAGANEHCPGRLTGTTEAMLVEPAAGKAVRASVENPVAREITVTAARIRIIATFGADRAQIYRILASASMPAPVIKNPNPDRPAAAGRRAAPAPRARRQLTRGGTASRGEKRRVVMKAAGRASFRRVRPPALPVNVANFTGRGFDTCNAPSKSVMRAWRKRSRYRAIGIFIGGADRACGQRNLTASWVRTEVIAGWHFIPLYVGPQAEFNQLSSPAREARQAADDAVTQARKLGFGPRTPIYYDMEGYRPRRRREVLRFLTIWTRTLHGLGFTAGAYSSSASGVRDLSRQYSNHRYTMPDVIYDALWNGARNTRDRAIRPGEWAGHRRLHQYRGNVTQKFGGHRIDIDQDFVDVRLHTSGGTHQASPAVTQPDGAADVFYRGTDNRLWRVGGVSATGGAAPEDLGGKLAAQPTVVAPYPGVLDVFYIGTDHSLWEISRGVGRSWSAPMKISQMGRLGSPPAAVSQRNGVIDLFWKGTANNHLWHGQFSPGSGWQGPQDLGGSLASNPAPVESSPGIVQVFWKGTDSSLWHVVRWLKGTWTGPAKLGMGSLGGAPSASALSSGAIDVFWRGAAADQLWATSLVPGRPWAVPTDLAGNLASNPLPLMSAGGRVHVFWKGTDGQLWQVSRGPRVGWRQPSSLPMGVLRARPVGVVGRGGRSRVFWVGNAGHLRFAAQMGGHAWSGPHNLGGHVA